MPSVQSEQRVKQLEVQNVKLTEVKNNLRLNRLKTQQEIHQTMRAMKVLLLEREKQLIGDLDRAYVEKKRKLVNQLDMVAEELAACNLGLPAGTSILNLDEDARLELDLPMSEVKAVHDRILSLGEIRASQDCQRLPVKKVGRTLPLDMEHYDDDNIWLLSKKSKPDVSPDTPHEVDTVKSWLSRLPEGNAALAFDLTSFAAVETKSESSESTASSFELLNDPMGLPQYTGITEKAFREHLDKIHAQPIDKWLMHSDEECSSIHLPRAPVPESFRDDDGSECSFEDEEDDQDNAECSSDSFKFIHIISQLQNSNDAMWLPTPKTVPQEADDDDSAAASHRRFLKKSYFSA